MVGDVAQVAAQLLVDAVLVEAGRDRREDAGQRGGGGGVGRVQGELALSADLAGGAVVDAGGGVQPDAGVAVLVVVVGEELLGERAGVGQGPEALGKTGAYFSVLNAASENGLSLETCGR